MTVDQNVLKMLHRELKQDVESLKHLKLRGDNVAGVRKVIANLEAQNQVLLMHMEKK